MLFVLFQFVALALAAPLNLPLDLDAFKNVTATNRCSTSREWRAYGFLIEDCFTAIQSLYINEVLKKRNEIYEFVAGGTSPTTPNPWVRTPSQYTVSEYITTLPPTSFARTSKPLLVADKENPQTPAPFPS